MSIISYYCEKISIWWNQLYPSSTHHVIYFQKDKRKKNIEYHTINNLLDGPYRLYDIEGKLLSDYNYSSGKLNGDGFDYDVYLKSHNGDLMHTKKRQRWFLHDKEIN